MDHAGTLWIGTGYTWAERRTNAGGLNRYHPETESFDHFIHAPNDSFSLRDNRISAIYEDTRGNFWVGTWAD
ncbi:MAG: hypothetical protein IPL46_30855 [Saprospiraceae bacterium]|nr:hypothetical protein [Saprospiraceae bacterium]